MSLLRESGLQFVGMSSVGPSIAIVTDRSREEVAKLIEPLGLEIAIETKVDNEGLKVHMAGAARAGASEDDGPRMRCS